MPEAIRTPTRSPRRSRPSCELARPGRPRRRAGRGRSARRCRRRCAGSSPCSRVVASTTSTRVRSGGAAEPRSSEDVTTAAIDHGASPTEVDHHVSREVNLRCPPSTTATMSVLDVAVGVEAARGGGGGVGAARGTGTERVRGGARTAAGARGDPRVLVGPAGGDRRQQREARHDGAEAASRELLPKRRRRPGDGGPAVLEQGGHPEEAVDLAVVPDRLDLDTRLAQASGVGLALVAAAGRTRR